MDIEKMKAMETDYDKINYIYQNYNEDNRLKSQSGRIEFETTIHYIEKYLKTGMKILDLGAGTGIYSFYFANMGYDVTAIEITKKHVDFIKDKMGENKSFEIIHGNALDELEKLEESSYDLVLCFGPLYHISKESERMECVERIKRVLKKDGLIYLALIHNDFIIATETMCYDTNYIVEDSFDRVTYKVPNEPFVFYKIEDARKLIKKSSLQIVHEVASDGLSELLQDKIDKMMLENYKEWFKYHLYTCERPEFLGTTSHLLYVAKLE